MKIVLLSFFILSSLIASAQPNTTGKEIVIVSFIWFPTSTAGVYFFYADNRIEKIPIEQRTKEQIEEIPFIIFKNQLIATVFNNLYKEGWELIPCSEDDPNLFIFER